MGNYSHNGCKGCLHFYINHSEQDLPCRWCKGTTFPGSDEHKNRQDCWTPAEEADENGGESISDENSPVDHPAHYTQGDIECIDAMESAFGVEELAAYCKIAAFKYIWRCKLKNGLEDVDKAMWYLRKFKELKEKGNAET